MILGVDYGESWCGIATSEGSLADPLKTVPTKNIFAEVERLKPEKVVVGISEKNMAKKTLVFVDKLAAWTKMPIETVDETLTSVEAAGIKTKDKQKQHAVAAALILQRYLDNM
ncbi:RuvX/YqgF family protein [Patescibacteria group bacterium]|nr:RuvX/YqgF family protein [Patescibacteria group bacterium]